MLKKSMLVLSLAAILVAGCGQEKPKAQDQPLPQAKPPVQVETKTNEPKVLSKKIVDKIYSGYGTNKREIIVEERQIETVMPNGKKKYEIQYFNAKTGGRIVNYKPNQKTEPFPEIQNKGKDVSDFKSH